MNKQELTRLLEEVLAGRLSVVEAGERLGRLPFHDIGCARLDLHRELRSGFAEAVYAEGKSVEHLLRIVGAFLEDPGRVLVTRLGQEQTAALRQAYPRLIFNESGRVAYFKGPTPPTELGQIGIISAGTSDLAVAQEAAVCAEYFGLRVTMVNDVGIAGLHRLLGSLSLIEEQDLLIVVAGMEGALPGVVAGICSIPVIAVPTSVGYGACFGGLTALLGMLVSCSPGLTVVNIDNGFGAALAAAKIVGRFRGRSAKKSVAE